MGAEDAHAIFRVTRPLKRVVTSIPMSRFLKGERVTVYLVYIICCAAFLSRNIGIYTVIARGLAVVCGHTSLWTVRRAAARAEVW